MTRALVLKKYVKWCPTLVLTIPLVFAFCAPAYAYTLNVLVAIAAEDNHDSTATYVGTHTLQVLQVQHSDTDTVGVEGRLYKNAFLPSVVSQCTTGGTLPQATFHVCGTAWTHSCRIPDGPFFQALSSSGGIFSWSNEVSIYCPEPPLGCDPNP
jgi:hypothetical protein